MGNSIDHFYQESIRIFFTVLKKKVVDNGTDGGRLSFSRNIEKLVKFLNLYVVFLKQYFRLKFIRINHALNELNG